MCHSTCCVRGLSSHLWLVATAIVVLGSCTSSTTNTMTAAFVVPSRPKFSGAWRLCSSETSLYKTTFIMKYNQNPQGFLVSSYSNRQNLTPIFSSKTPDNERDDGQNEAEDNESSLSQSDDKKRAKKAATSRRVGGRPLQSKTVAKKEAESNNNGFLSKWATILVPAFAVVFLLKSLLGGLLFGNDEQSNYVYYQSSVYETRSYGSDGKVETSRKESVRTNAPSLLNSQRTNYDDRSNGKYLLKDVPDDDFDEEIESIIRQQSRAIRNELLDF